jgi:hypothetical protein
MCFFFFFLFSFSLTSSNGPSLQFKARVARQLGSGSAIRSKNDFLILELKPSRATRVLGSARVSRFGEPKLDPEPIKTIRLITIILNSWPFDSLYNYNFLTYYYYYYYIYIYIYIQHSFASTQGRPWHRKSGATTRCLA